MAHVLRWSAAAIFVSPAAACAGHHTDTGSAAASGLAAPASEEGAQLRQTYGGLAPGAEVHYCQLYQLPNRTIEVQRFQHTYTPGGHHIILYPTSLTPADLSAHPGVFDCDQVMPNRGNIGFSYVGGKTGGEQTYPNGVAWHFDPGQIVMLESHMLNPGAAPLDVDYRLNLWYATAPVTDRVGTIFFYDNNIYIPAGGQATAHMVCQIPANIHLLALAPHMHVRGKHFRTQAAGGSLSAPMPLAGSDDWAGAEPVRYDPPIDLSAGQRFEFSCDYDNPDSQPIVSGGSKTNNEMCLLIGSYYPKLDFPFEFCMLPGSGPTYDGASACVDTLSCFTSAANPSSVEAQRCATGTCAGSSAAFNDFFSCSALKCFFPGNCAASSCQQCVLQSCSDQMAACRSTGCP